jgi:tripartite-type tricarboxylate transporter receptor subunit TctC
VNRRNLLLLSAASSIAALTPRIGAAQASYPDHVVRLIVPRPSGGVVDVIARAWGETVEKSFGPTYVENVGGGGGTIGAVAASRAPADGYSLFLGTTSELVISPILARQNYDPIASFEPIAIICDSPAAVVVNASVPARNLKELVEYARNNQGKMNYGSAGANTVSNLAGELFKHLAGLSDVTHIPYKGGGQAMTDLIAGQIPIVTPMMSPSTIALHQQGRVRILAVASEQRVDAMPDLPTAAEQGYPEFVARLFVGLFAPAKTPKPMIDKVEKVTQAAVQDPGLKSKFAAGGFDVIADSGTASAAAYINKEIARWKPILDQMNLKRS